MFPTTGPWPVGSTQTDIYGNDWVVQGTPGGVSNTVKKAAIVLDFEDTDTFAKPRPATAAEAGTADVFGVVIPTGGNVIEFPGGFIMCVPEKVAPGVTPKKCVITNAECNAGTFDDSQDVTNNDVLLTKDSIECIDKLLFICNKQIGVRSRFYGWGSGSTEYSIDSSTAVDTVVMSGSIPNICTTCATNAILNGQIQMQSPFEENVPCGGLVQVQPRWRWNGGAWVNQANGAHGRRNSEELVNHDTGWGISGQLNLPACKEDNLFEFEFILQTNTLKAGEKLTYHTSNFGVFVEEFCHRNMVRG